MEYRALAKYIRISPRKVRLVVDAVKPLSVMRALEQLSLMKKHAALTVRDVIQSAIANAKGKNADTDSLTFKSIDVTEGPVMKRFHAVSRGMGHSYKKRMTHIRVVLVDRIQKTKKLKGI